MNHHCKSCEALIEMFKVGSWCDGEQFMEIWTRKCPFCDGDNMVEVKR